MVVAVVVVVVKRHERFKGGRVGISMSMRRCVVHLRAWLLEEAESLLLGHADATDLWVFDFLCALWDQSTLPDPILDSAFILPRSSFDRFLLFAARNYPVEFTSAIASIILYDAAAVEGPLDPSRVQ